MKSNSNNPQRKQPSAKITSAKAPIGKSIPASGSKEPRVVQSAASGLKRNSLKPPEYQSVSAPSYENSPGDFLSNAIFEYLMKKGMIKTIEVFKEEMSKNSSARKPIDPNIEVQLLDAFDRGNRETFFAKWTKFVSTNIRNKDDESFKLEFYLHIYFVAYSIHPNNQKASQGLNKDEVNLFREYLDNNGRDLAQTSEFLPYYALPYVPNPMNHSSFKHIFTKEWVGALRNRLEAFLNGISSSEESSTLFQMYQVYENNLHQKNDPNAQRIIAGQNQNIEHFAKVIAQLEASNQDLMLILQEYNDKYSNLTREYQNLQKNEEMARNHLFESHTKWMAFLKELLNVTNDLVSVVENQNRGVAIGDRVFDALKKRVQKYENFLNANIDDLFSQSQDISTFDKFSTSQDGTPDHSSISNANFRPRMEDRSPVQQSYVTLNFEKIKSCFLGQSDNKVMQCALLQALRWRITRTRGAALRREVIIGYSKSDILDVRREYPCVLDALFKNQTRQVCEFGARFINALTSDYYGRSYLLESDKVAILLIDIFVRETGDTIVRRNCLGALQKLSLRKKPQLVMIEKDIIKWILHALKHEKDALGEYFYEYATALLMNLSLRSAGKKKCEQSEIEVLSMLNDLLEHENMQVRSFVNGTLYSLLSNPKFKEQAHAMGMEEILSYLMENADERYRKQIHYIIQRLNTDQADEETQSDTNEEDNDYDDMEEEDEIGEDDDMEDSIEDPNVLVGEDLLRRFFSLSGPEALRQNSIIQEVMEETKSFKDSTIRDNRQHSNIGTPLNRPTTPLMLTKLIQQQSGVETLNPPEEFIAKPRVLRTPNSVNQEEFPKVLDNQSRVFKSGHLDPLADNRQSFNDIKGFVPPPKGMNENIPYEKKVNFLRIPHPSQKKLSNQSKRTLPKIPRTPPESQQIKGSNYHY